MIQRIDPLIRGLPFHRAVFPVTKESLGPGLEILSEAVRQDNGVYEKPGTISPITLKKLSVKSKPKPRA